MVIFEIIFGVIVLAVKIHSILYDLYSLLPMHLNRRTVYPFDTGTDV